MPTSSQVEPPPRSAGVLRKRRVPLPWPEDREFRILSIDGGGIRGIFPAAFLSGLEERYLGGSSVSRYFDLIAGTSTGGIIAIGLGAGFKARELRDLYIERGCEIFPPMNLMGRLLMNIKGVLRYRYDRQALVNILFEKFGDRKLGESQTRLCIPSCEGHHSEVYVFKTPHHPDFRLDHRETMVKVASATSAAPTYFRPLEDGGYTLVDGGLWANSPIMVGLVDALSCFSVPRERVRILSLGCGDEPYTVRRLKIRLGGMLLWYNIIYAAMRFQSLGAVGQAGLLIGADRINRVDVPTGNRKIALDDWNRARAELPSAAAAALDEYGETVESHFLREPVVPYRPLVAAESYTGGTTT